MVDIPEGRSLGEKKKTESTVLSTEQEKSFQDWYGGVSSKLGLASDPDDPKHYYDYRGLYKATLKGKHEEYIDPGTFKKGLHFPSEYKTKGHPRTWLPDPDNPDVEVNTKTGETRIKVGHSLGAQLLGTTPIKPSGPI